MAKGKPVPERRLGSVSPHASMDWSRGCLSWIELVICGGPNYSSSYVQMISRQWSKQPLFGSYQRYMLPYTVASRKKFRTNAFVVRVLFFAFLDPMRSAICRLRQGTFALRFATDIPWLGEGIFHGSTRRAALRISTVENGIYTVFGAVLITVLFKESLYNTRKY